MPVPTSSIYSRSDGIIRWHLCTDAEGPMRENIEVRGSHCGIQYNLAAVFAIADRLALLRSAEAWRRSGRTRE